MFEPELKELIESQAGAAAIFCDYEGESIAVAPGGWDPYEVRVVGAHLAPWVHGLQRAARATGQHERLSLATTASARTILVEALPGGYYLALALPPSAPWPVLRRRMKDVADRFAAEV